MNSTPDFRRARRRVRGQSEVLGAVLLIALTIIGTGTILTLGAPTVDDSREHATFERVEDAMTALDSRSAKVALGNAPVQTLELGNSAGGRYDVNEQAGWIRVAHYNYTEEDGNSETVYNETLGSVEYRHDGAAIAYQGGGVWRRSANGSVMVSPPEIHYRDKTLTLPLVLTDGSGHVSGPTTAVVSRDAATERVYPSERATYETDGREYRNPVQKGRVDVTVHSAYYVAWAEYFRTKTQGNVTVDHANETATLELTAGGTQGDFEMPREGSSIDVRGLTTDHAVENFTVTLAPDDIDAAEFDNLQWAMYADRGRYQLELYLRKSGEIAGVERCRSNEFSLTAYFSDRNGDPYHAWHNETAFTSECVDRDGDGVADETRVHANFTGTTAMEMTDLSSNDLTHFNPSGDTRPESYTFDEHESSVDWEPVTFSDESNPTAEVRHVTDHYFTRLGPNFNLNVDDKESNTVNEGASYGTLEYDAHGRVTYMHITENRIRVRLTR